MVWYAVSSNLSPKIFNDVPIAVAMPMNGNGQIICSCEKFVLNGAMGPGSTNRAVTNDG